MTDGGDFPSNKASKASKCKQITQVSSSKMQVLIQDVREWG